MGKVPAVFRKWGSRVESSGSGPASSSKASVSPSRHREAPFQLHLRRQTAPVSAVCSHCSPAAKSPTTGSQPPPPPADTRSLPVGAAAPSSGSGRPWFYMPWKAKEEHRRQLPHQLSSPGTKSSPSLWVYSLIGWGRWWVCLARPPDRHMCINSIINGGCLLTSRGHLFPLFLLNLKGQNSTDPHPHCPLGTENSHLPSKTNGHMFKMTNKQKPWFRPHSED